jgi:predicted unusual protein kinase regulating ubiquinone biosynthesis (AarF/ABC1/UbiB family)
MTAFFAIMEPLMLRTRYRRIVTFWARVLISLFMWELLFPRIGLRFLTQQTRSDRLSRSAAQYRILAIQLGGVLIKVGQFLSSRVDVLPQEITAELAGLQDEVPPENFDDISKVAEGEFGMTLFERYATFDQIPLAAASLGQVHRARLYPNTLEGANNIGSVEVVVKIQRPNIENIIATDLAALRTVGRWLQRYRPISKRVNINALLDEFTRTLYEEIDYLAEGRNAETFAVNFRMDSSVRVPKVVWTHTTRRVLTLENVGAIKISDYEAISSAGIDRSEVAKRLLNTYLKQIFEDGFFHADPHPGNLFISPLSVIGEYQASKVDWTLTFVDFGMVGRVPAKLRTSLRELLVAIGTRDVPRMIKAYRMMGILLPGADLTQIERASALMFDRFWGKSMTELQKTNMDEMMEFTGEFRDLLYTMPFQMPQDIIFLGRCVGILSGMCTGLDPEFNVFVQLAPYAEKLISDEVESGWRFWLKEVEAMVMRMWAMPTRIESVLGKMERGEMSVRDPQLTEQMRRMERTLDKAAWALVFAALLLGGIQLLQTGHVLFGEALAVGAGAVLLRIILGGR